MFLLSSQGRQGRGLAGTPLPIFGKQKTLPFDMNKNFLIVIIYFFSRSRFLFFCFRSTCTFPIVVFMVLRVRVGFSYTPQSHSFFYENCYFIFIRNENCYFSYYIIAFSLHFFSTVLKKNVMSMSVFKCFVSVFVI